nr:ployprotein [Amrasca biguttula iflavirus 1]
MASFKQVKSAEPGNSDVPSFVPSTPASYADMAKIFSLSQVKVEEPTVPAVHKSVDKTVVVVPEDTLPASAILAFKRNLREHRSSSTLAQHVGYLKRIHKSIWQEESLSSGMQWLARFVYREYKIFKNRLELSRRRAKIRVEKRRDGVEKLKRAGRFVGAYTPWLANLIAKEAGCSVRTYAQENEVDSDEDDGLSSYVPSTYVPRRRRIKTLAEIEKLPWPERAEEFVLVRNPVLLQRCRLIQRLRRENVATSEIYAHLRADDKCADHQMDRDAEQNSSFRAERSVNVVQTEQRYQQVAEEQEVKSDAQLCSDDVITCFDNLCSREQLLYVKEWTTTEEVNHRLLGLELPLAIPAELPNSPVTLPFLNHQYFRGDIRIRIQVTATPFMSGRLQVSWYYGAHLDAGATLRRHMAAESQMLHATLDIGTASSAELYIPYRYYKPLLSCHPTLTDVYPLVMGQLIITNLTKLRIGTNTQNSIFINVYASLHNTEFTGMIPRRNLQAKASHQMEGVAIAAAAQIVNNYIDKNYDNPTEQIRPTFVAPQSAPSWSLGTNISVGMNELRLSSAVTPVVGTTVPDPLSASGIAQRWGLVNSFEWTSSLKKGAVLTTIEGSPILGEERYYKQQIEYVNPAQKKLESKLKRNVYYFPPVAVMSHCFEYWTGNLEMRFEIVGTAFHQGKLLCVYVPGKKLAEEDLVLDKLVSSPCAYFDYKADSTQFNFMVPYISSVPYTIRRMNKQMKALDAEPLGHVYLIVVNPLVITTQIANSVDILFYMRGGPSFQLLVPAQPTIGLSNTVVSVTPGSAFVIPVAGYESYYPGVWGDCPFNNYFKSASLGDGACVFRTEAFFNRLALFTRGKYNFGLKAATNYSYYLYNETNVKIKVAGDKDRTPEKYTEVNYFVPYFKGEATFMLPVKSEACAKLFVQAVNGAFGNYTTVAANTSAMACLYPYWDDNKDGFEPPNAEFQIITITGNKVEEDFEVVSHQMDPRVEDDKLPLVPGPSGLMKKRVQRSVNENHDSLKDICRRFQYYGTFNNVSKIVVLGEALFSFPACPQGLELSFYMGGDTNIVNQINNRARDGLIPVIMNGFRGYRGSIRFRIVFPNSVLANGDFYVQHFPAEPLYVRGMQYTEQTRSDSIETHFQHGNGYHIQSVHNNNVLSFEVPYYIPYDWCLMQDPYANNIKTGLDEFRYASSLGRITVGGFMTVSAGSAISVFYALGDDATPTIFQGFSPMMLTQDVDAATAIREEVANHQMLKCDADHQIFSKVTDYFGKKMVESVADRLEEEPALSSLAHLAKSGKLESLFDTANSTILEMKTQAEQQGIPQVVLTALHGLSHLALSPTVGHAAISFSFFLLSLGILHKNTYQRAVDLMTVILGNLQSAEAKQPQKPADADAQMDISVICKDSQEFIELATLIATGMCASVGLKNPFKAKDINEWLRESFDGATKAFRFGAGMIGFFKPLMSYIKRVYDRICDRMDPEKVKLEEFLKHQEIVNKWVEESLYLTDKELETSYDIYPNLVDRLNSAFVIGSLLMAQSVASAIPGFTVLKDLHNKVSKLRNELLDRGVASSTRREPFVIWVQGAAGIGKTHMAQQTIVDCLRHAEITCVGNPIYTHSPTSKWWDNCNQEPCVFMDDAFVMRDGEVCEMEIATLMALKSNALFTPPIAECDRKKKRYAPDLVYLNANTLFPECTKMEVKEALYRRRDLLFKVQIKQEYLTADANKLSRVPADVLARFGHLEFFIARNPERDTTQFDTAIEYPQFIELARNKFREFYRRQIQRVERENAYLREAGIVQANDAIAAQPLHEIMQEYINSNVFNSFQIYKQPIGAVAQPIVNHQSDPSSSEEYIYKEFIKECNEAIELDLGFVPTFIARYTSQLDNTVHSKEQMQLKEIQKLLDPVEPVLPAVFGKYYTEMVYIKRRFEHILKEFNKQFYVNAQNFEKYSKMAEDVMEVQDSHEAYVEKGYNRPTHCCSHHTQLVAKYFSNLVDFEEFSRGLPYYMRKERPSFFIQSINTLAEEGKMCRHWSLLFNYHRTELGYCCYKANRAEKFAHYCRNDVESLSCDINCAMSPSFPILDKACSQNCVVQHKLFKHIYRRMLLLIQTLKIARCSNLGQGVPEFLFPTTCERFKLQIFEKLADFWQNLKLGISRACRMINTALGRSFAFIRTHATLVGCVTLLCGIAAGALWGRYKLTNDMINDIEKQSNINAEKLKRDISVEHQLIGSGDPRVVQRAARLAARIRHMENPERFGANHQMATHFDVCRRRVARASQHMVTYSISETDTSIHNRKNVTNIFYIGDRYAITTRHAMEVMTADQSKVVLLTLPDTDNVCKIEFKDIIFSYFGEGSSIALLKFPAQFPLQKNLINLFATEADHISRTPTKAHFMYKDDDILVEKHIELEIEPEAITIGNLVGASTVKINGLYKYPLSKYGYCATILLAENLSSPIFAFHVAGKDSGLGYAEPLFREQFVNLLTTMPIDVKDDIPCNDVNLASIDLNTQLYPRGSVSKNYAYVNPRDTAIHQSAIFDYIPHTTEPAPLSPSDPRLPPFSSPLVKGCEKHGVTTRNFPQHVNSLTYSRFYNFLLAKCKPVRNSFSTLVLTDQQAVCGDSQLPFCKPLQWNSSEGYPFSSIRPAGASGKRWLFDLKETTEGYELQGYHPYLASHLRTKREGRKNGVQQVTIFTDCLKDSRISTSKVSVPGKTRIFSMSPVDYTIEFRKYFYDFIAAYQSNNLACLNAIGINVFGEEWHKLAIHLKTYSNICTGDYSNFGPGLNEEVAYQCCKLILEWYNYYESPFNQDNFNIRNALLSELINAKHLAKDLLYEVAAGIPSGSPITVVLNSLVNTFYLMAAWEMLSESWELSLRSIENFFLHTRVVTYGDDFIMSVSDVYKDLFNTKTISDCLSQYEIIITDAFKGDTVTPYSTLENSTFLKGAFVQRHHYWWYGLQKSQIEEIPNWINSKNNVIDFTLENARTALYYAHGWGENYFNYLRKKLTSAFIKRKIVFHHKSFSQIEQCKLNENDEVIFRELRRIVG